MEKFVRLLTVEATQWFHNGDHPLDDCTTIELGKPRVTGEGRIVRYFRSPKVPGTDKCGNCKLPMHSHGWIDPARNQGHGYVVCPGDWIVTEQDGVHIPVRPEVMKRDYRTVESL